MRTPSRTPPRRRAAFTLIEVMVVILIIALLMSMLLAGFSAIRDRVSEAQVRSDITQISGAISAFKQKFNVDYLPSRFALRSVYDPNDPLQAASQNFLKKMFPRIKFVDQSTGTAIPTGLPDMDLDGSQCLVFFLGGYYFDGANQVWLQGFSTSASTPFIAPSSVTTRIGPFFEFKSNQLTPEWRFLDPFGTPFLYITAINRTYNSPQTPLNALSPNFVSVYPDPMNPQPVQPYGEMVNGQPRYLNADSFQLISAGRDQLFGPGGQWVPEGPGYGGAEPGADDVANFHDSPLGATGN